jgi:hypothetical protein
MKNVNISFEGEEILLEAFAKKLIEMGFKVRQDFIKQEAKGRSYIYVDEEGFNFCHGTNGTIIPIKNWDESIKAAQKFYDEVTNKIEIRGYKPDYSLEGHVKFGCNTYAKYEVEAFKHLVDKSGADISIGGIKITEELLKNILDKIVDENMREDLPF